MELPGSVKVDGVRYAVKGLPRDEAHAKLNGIIYFPGEGQEILIEGRLGDRKKALTFLHEIIHAALLPLQMPAVKEEAIVLRLEQGLASAFESNPGVFRKLIGVFRKTRSRQA